VKVSKALDARGTRLATEFFTPKSSTAAPNSRDGIVLIRNADGTVTVVREVSAGTQTTGPFTPNTHQAIIQIKRGEKLTETVKQLDVSLSATVRTGIEPISQARGLVQNQNATGVGGPDVEMTARYEIDPNGKQVADVFLNYDSKTVHPVGVADELPGSKGTTNIGYGNHTVHGIQVTDKDGKPFGLGLRSGSNQLDGTGKRLTAKVTLELVPDRNSNNPPVSITFWGTHARQVQIPVTLKDVPLSLLK
jgi:hypothetical protein